ncbi:MAG: beta-lactamase [Adhaeribacter sp.]|nr:beta-lactamase [Adhaeribacter sp.]
MIADRRKFLKNISVGVAGISILPFLPHDLWAEGSKAGALPRSLPELQGLSSAHIQAFVEATEKQNLGLHSLMVVRHGKVIAEGWWDPYNADLPHTLFSLSKSFTSTAIGFAVAEGLLKTEDKVISFFPAEKPEKVSAHLAAMRLKDLLTMTSGHEKDTLGPLLLQKEGGWAEAFLSLLVEREPGTYFLYNTGATYMLSAILQRVTSKTVLNYLTPRLFQPLNITGADWENDPAGINTGGFGLRLKTEDIAKFGQFYLQKGKWNGKQLLPARWIDEATAFQVPNSPTQTPAHEWNQGYGYQFWRCRHNAYRADGAMGQYCIVMPEQDAVVAMTGETHDMQAIMNQVWEHLLPGLEKAPLPPNKSGQTALQQKLKNLTLLPAINAIRPSPNFNSSGKAYKLAENTLNAQSVSFNFDKNTCTFSLKDEQGEHTIICGLQKWVKGQTHMPGNPPKFIPLRNPLEDAKLKVAAFGTWQDPETFVMTWAFYDTPHSDQVTCHFKNDTVRLSFKNSIAVKSPGRAGVRPVLEGKLIS